MIKTLRKKFISIAMISTSIVLFLIIGSINLANFISIDSNINYKLRLIAENGGKFPEPEFSQKGEDKDRPKPDNPGFPRKDLSKEAAFDSRYFTVALDESGNVITVDTGRIFATDSEAAADYATRLYSKGRTSGTIDNYKFITCNNEDGSVLYIFLDCEREYIAFKSFLFASLGISIIGLILVFILVFIFSGNVVKPMAESYRKQKRFITDASHELKTPLTIIDANTEVIEMTSGENDWTKSTRNQVNRLSNLVEKLVFLTRMDEEDTQVEFSDFSISDAILDTAEPFTSIARSKGKTLSLDVAPDVRYTGDEKTIRQLISLLMDNAMKYSSENGAIKLSLREQGRNKIITLWNSVDEIKIGRHDELFERFYRLDSSHNSKTGGFGIGLSVAYAIVEAHKGKISARSADGKSIEFTVTLGRNSK